MSNKADIAASADRTAIPDLAARVLGQVPALLEAAGKAMTDVQRQKLESHLLGMARRSVTGETLPEFDKSLFDEISPPALRLSERIVAMFTNLPGEEALLLSVHFDTADNKA